MTDWILNRVEGFTAAVSDALGPWLPLLLLLVIVPVVVKCLRWYVLSVHEPRDKARTDAARRAREQAAFRGARGGRP